MFRIGVIGDQVDGNNLATGASLVNDNSFFVANHRFVDTQDKLRNAVLHEMGHTLGLRHHGAHQAVRSVREARPVDADYQSVMNFLYQYSIFNYSEESYEIKTADGVHTVPADWDALVINTPRIGSKGATAAAKQQPTDITWTKVEPVREGQTPVEEPATEPAVEPTVEQEAPKPAPQAEVNVAAIVVPIVTALAIAGLGFALVNTQGIAIPGLAL